MKITAWLRFGAAALTTSLALLAQPAAAAPVIVTEVGDAGDSLATAADARVGSTDRVIVGSLSQEPRTLDLVDLFRIDVLRSSLLRASTGPGNDPALIADPVLFLFDANGVGVAMNDESGGFGQALMELINVLTPGDYFLGIAFAGMEPVDAQGNPLFDTFGSGAVVSNGALAGWIGSPFAIDPGIEGRYNIAVEVPAPGTLALVAGGLFVLTRRQRALRVQRLQAA